ncbi:MAG: hydroxymethylbilane synthase [Epsilonproteobacteria bacterium]|nr:hydroxymethylbilane synthase [Campylobacterota bacterium]
MKIGTRGSKLALWQANYVADRLKENGIDTEIVIIKTTGDKIKDKPLYTFGGKGLFIKEIEEALIDKRVDIAVHSMKDVPAALAEGTKIAACLTRELPFDAFVSIKYKSIDELPDGSVIGTASLRRLSQLILYKPDLKIKTLRGNMQTRLKKLESGMYDGIIVAAAAFRRLGIADRITEILGVDRMIPASTQGIIGIQTRNEDETKNSIRFLNDKEAEIAAAEERSFVNSFGGGCHLPVAAYLEHKGKSGRFYAFLSDIDGKHYIKRIYDLENKGTEGVGLAAYSEFKSMGAQELLTSQHLNSE